MTTLDGMADCEEDMTVNTGDEDDVSTGIKLLDGTTSSIDGCKIESSDDDS